MASKKAQFKARLQENKGKSMDGTKLFGRMEKLTYKSVKVWSDEIEINVKINSPDVSDYDRNVLKDLCNNLLGYIKDFKSGAKIPLSNVCNTIFDLKVIENNIQDGKNCFQCMTI